MIFCGVYSQLIIRWQVLKAGALPESFQGKAIFVARLLLNPWILTALAATFIGGVAWMLATTKFEISYAYPWVSLVFIFVFLGGIFLFGESFTFPKIAGMLLILSGIVVIAKG